MRILFIHEVNYLSKPIFEMHEFPEHLASRGHEVRFVHFPEGEKWRASKRLEPLMPITGRVLPDVKLGLVTPWTVRLGGLDRIVTATLSFFQVFFVLKSFRPDVVVSYSVPTSGWQSLIASKMLRTPYVFRALDVSHKIRKTHLAPLIQVAEKFVYRNADWLSANNPAMLRYCLESGAREDASSVNLPPLSLQHFEISRDEILRTGLGFSKGSRVYLYMGSFFYFSGLPDVINSFASSRQVSDFLLLIGGGEQDAELRSLVESLNISEYVCFTGYVSFADLPRYLSIADIALNPMAPSLVSHAAIPNKVIQYLAAGLPVVSTRLEGLLSTFGSDKSITYAEGPEDVFTVAQKKLNEHPELGAPSERKAMVRTLFNLEDKVTEFEDLLLQVASNDEVS